MASRRLALRNLTVGTFVLAGLLAMAYMSLTVGGLSLGGPETITLYAPFDEIGGLKPRAKVVIAGVKVGEVTEVELDEDYRAMVSMDLDARFAYPLDTMASIMTSGILGDQYILLQLGGEPRNLKDGDTIDFTESALLLERLVGKLIHNTGVDDEK
jgi:phospholipid/cholesterol/gamma-HCH transport system substrate-binding protein